MELKPILLDTNAYTALTQNLSDAVEIIQYTPWVGLNAVILGELLAGFAVGSKAEQNRSRLNYFLEMEKVNCLVIDTDTAEVYARVYQGLRKKVIQFPLMICGLQRQLYNITSLCLATIAIFELLITWRSDLVLRILNYSKGDRHYSLSRSTFSKISVTVSIGRFKISAIASGDKP